MNRITQSLQVSVIWTGIVMGSACSSIPQASNSIPEIQGVWRYSDGHWPQAKSSLTFEFQGNQFRVSGYPDIYAHGQYSFEPLPQGVYQLNLNPQESRSFEMSKLQVQTTGGRILFIDRKLYRRILRH